MYLKQLDITGFKSFANKTTLDFLPSEKVKKGERTGVTVIVGPNGSGKSNISDAIRWVMGEQSMKNLRGKKSDDIIFAGSNKRSRLGTASVTMHFDNKDKRIPLEYEDVQVTRKIDRSGEGEYLINGSRVRLMDVIDLLAAAGVGKESHCVVNQGMTDATLLATAAERRAMIEDAAGVKQFQIKKDRALRKMETTEKNIERVEELMVEIEPHLKSLKRQSEKAEKGKEVYTELKKAQRLYFGHLWHAFAQERKKATEEKNQIGIDMKNAQRDVDKINDAIMAESQKVEQANVVTGLEEQKKACYAELTAIEKDVAIAQGRAEIEKERIVQVRAIKSVPVDLAYVQSRVGEMQRMYGQLMKDLDNVTALEDLVAFKERMRLMSAALTKLHEDAGKTEIAVTPEDHSEKISHHESEIARLESDSDTKKGRITTIKEKIARSDAKIKEALSADHAARQKFFTLEKDLRARQDVLTEIRNRFNDAKIRLAKVEVREEDLQNEVREELGVDVKELSYDEAPFDREVVEKKIAKLKSQYEHIGGIDPMVVEEYGETQERFDFLRNESQDLHGAIISLREIVKEMDQKIDKEFARAYTHINKEFTKYFRIIFGGGSAHLTKIKIPSKKKNSEISQEGDDGAQDQDAHSDDEQGQSTVSKKLEIGIEISAHPPGKKVKHLSLLSGGERSLTAIALLFAIISFNPPPFAILDEVEAALDEANSRRFGRILQDLSRDTQFVIITHNRETMRQADLLYGVTMRDDGSSHLLSVRLDTLQLSKDSAPDKDVA